MALRLHRRQSSTSFSPTATVSKPSDDATEDGPETDTGDEDSDETATEVSESTPTYPLSFGGIQRKPNQPKKSMFPSIRLGGQFRIQLV
jgi:hypothetical protein